MRIGWKITTRFKPSRIAGTLHCFEPCTVTGRVLDELMETAYGAYWVNEFGVNRDVTRQQTAIDTELLGLRGLVTGGVLELPPNKDIWEYY